MKLYSNEAVGEILDMLVYIVRHTGCKLLLALDEGIVVTVEVGKFLKQRHKLLIRAVGLDSLTILLIQLVAAVDDGGQPLYSPLPHGACKRIIEDKSAQTIVYELYEAAVHNLLVKVMVGEQRRLVSVEQGHSLSVELTANGIKDGIDKNPDELVHTLKGSLRQ